MRKVAAYAMKKVRMWSLHRFAKVQEWLGHSNIATTRIYDHRKTRPEDSPTFKAPY
jgi:integrase